MSCEMSCEMATEDFRVVVQHPKSLATHCGECVGIRTLRPCFDTCAMYCCCLFCVLFIIGLFSSGWWIAAIVQRCHVTPNLSLEDLRIRDIAVNQNTTTGTWQVKSDINVNLSAWNTNTVSGCFTTYRLMLVRVEFKGQIILLQEVPLGFGLKPRRSRPVMVNLQGDGFPLKTELGWLLEEDLRNGSSVGLQIFFDTRYLRNDRKAGWMCMGCDVMAKTPAQDASVGSAAGGIISSWCISTC